MSNLLSKGQAMLARHLQVAASPVGTLTYHPVANPTDAIDLTGKAWVGRTVFSRLNKEGGAAVVFGDRDLMCPVTELPGEPQRGDRVTEAIGGVEVVFEVMEPLGEPSHRYADPGRTLWRIHLKEVS